jgi:hypothetical protein
MKSIPAFINRLVVIVLIIIGTFSPSFAESNQHDSGDPEGQTGFLQPGDMTEDDYAMMTEYSYRYKQCLEENSLAGPGKYSDPRQAVDNAMKECAFVLEELDQLMAKRNFHPDFRQGYIRRTSNRAVNSTLRDVIIRFATQGTPAE